MRDAAARGDGVRLCTAVGEAGLCLVQAVFTGGKAALRRRGDGALQKRGLVQLCELLRLQKELKKAEGKTQP